jgi:FkbM family methyltransferase
MGVVATYAAGRVGPGGAVHAFEPQPRLAATLRQSAALNGYRHLHVHAVALSSADGELPLYVDPDETATASFTRPDYPTEVVRVPVHHAGRALQALALPAIRLLKLDVEGHEAAFLEGAREYLQGHPPDVILFESHPSPTPFFRRRPVSVLRALGYELFQVPKALCRMSLRRLAAPDAPAGPGFDFVALRPGAPALGRAGGSPG